MNNLSDRLQLIADLIDNGEAMADIGTDHGFLPVYLYQSGICPKVILTDVSRGSIKKAEETVESSGCSINAGDLRCGYGLEPLNDGEVDTVVMAGMGGRMMRSILGKDLKKSLSMHKYILQPRNGQAELRFWLKNNGFTIISERLVKERSVICEVMVAVTGLKNTGAKVKSGGCGGIRNYSPNNSEPPEEQEIYYALPEAILAETKNQELGKQLFERRIRAEERVIEELKNARQDASIREKTAVSNIEYLRRAIENVGKVQ